LLALCNYLNLQVVIMACPFKFSWQGTIVLRLSEFTSNSTNQRTIIQRPSRKPRDALSINLCNINLYFAAQKQ